MNSFYYAGEVYFSGNLTKNIIAIATNCYNEKKEFFSDQMSSILSNASGSECPVHFGVKVDDVKIKELYDYVRSISTLGQEPGKKYFYKHKIG